MGKSDLQIYIIFLFNISTYKPTNIASLGNANIIHLFQIKELTSISTFLT
jgi:hypothetical protein